MIPIALTGPIARIAIAEGFEAAAILAVIDVESGGRLYARVNGRREPLIRFEGHYFDRRLAGDKRRLARAAGLAHPQAGVIANPASQSARYRLLARAEAIDRQAARESCSWGAGQVMGANWSRLGYPDVDSLVAEARSGIEGQVRLMLSFIATAGLRAPLAAHDWHAFARRYNGPAYARHGYHARLARAYSTYAAMALPGIAHEAPDAAILRQGARGPDVTILQRRLSALGYPLTADGVYGAKTRRAVAAFQREHGLAVDGLAGVATRQAIDSAKPWTVFWRLVRSWLTRMAIAVRG